MSLRGKTNSKASRGYFSNELKEWGEDPNPREASMLKAERMKECGGAGASGSGIWDRRSLIAVKSGLWGSRGVPCRGREAGQPQSTDQICVLDWSMSQDKGPDTSVCIHAGRTRRVTADVIKSESPGIFSQG